jgi:hypothetical protein
VSNMSQDTTIALLREFSPFVSMLFFAPADHLTPQAVMFNGTAAFVDTGERKLVLTNSHVYRRFRELRSETPKLAMFLTGSHKTQVLELKDAHVVDDGGSAVDLAAFAFEHPEQVGMIGKSYFRAPVWPPARPTPKTTAALIGFAGEHRQVGKDSLKINLSVFRDKVTSVSDRHFVLVDEERARISMKVNPTLGELGDLGGMSGSPAFAVGADGKRSFAGLLYEAGEGKEAMIFAVHADFLTAEGKIDRSKIRW